MGYYSETSFSPDCSVGYLLRRSQQMGVAALEPIFASEGLTGIQWSALVLIHLKRSTTGADIARDLSYDKGATTRLIDTLEERGWVTRERCQADRRVVNLDLTEAGREVALRCKRLVIRAWNLWLEDWPEADITTMIRLLQKLCATLETVAIERSAA